jgi:hypothetical protein
MAVNGRYRRLVLMVFFLLFGVSTGSFSQSGADSDPAIARCGATVTSQGDWAMYVPWQAGLSEAAYAKAVAACYRRYFPAVDPGSSAAAGTVIADGPPQGSSPCMGQTAALVAQAASGDNCCRSTRTGDAGGSCSWATCPRQFRCKKSECGG